MSIVQNWNFEVPMRNNQRIALEWLEKELSNPKKRFFFLEAPVGTGKSMFGMCASNYIHANQAKGINTCFLTPQKILQRQYESSFPNHLLTTLYGRNNYDCEKGVDCEIGAGFGKKCASCPYEAVRERCKSTPNAVMNYQLLMSLLAFSPSFKEHSFKLMVFDECHTLETYLTEFNNITLNQGKCHLNDLTWKLCTNTTEAFELIKNKTIKELWAKLEQLENEYPFLTADTNLDLTPEQGKIMERYLLLMEDASNMSEFVSCPAHHREAKYIVVHDAESFKIKHLYGAYNFIDLIEPYGEKFIFMSSTILDYKSICIELGIDPSEAAFLSLDSEFPVANRPIVYKPVTKMNAAWVKDEDGKRKLLKEIVTLLNNPHSNDNGIIHTVSYQIAEWLVQNLEGKIPHEIYHHNGGASRDEVINKYLMDTHKLKVLISPSITEGLDLKDDLGRFSIFVKVPFPYLGDQWIAKRKDVSQSWYQRQAILSLIQGSGRVVRSEVDYGTTYILDSSWEQLERSASKLIPKWWREAIKRV